MTEVLGVEVAGPPFLPEPPCFLAVKVFPGLLPVKLTTGPTVEVFESTGRCGFQSGGGIGVLGVVGVLGCDFFPLCVMVGTGGGGETGKG